MKLVGMRVRLQAEAMRIRNLRDEEFTVLQAVGTGPDTFVKLRTNRKEVATWFRWNELSIPAYRHARVPEGTFSQAAQSLLARAHQLVADTGGTLQLSAALKKAASENRRAAAQHLESLSTSVIAEPITLQVPISLHRHDGESFPQLVDRIAREQGLEFREAVRIASRAYPDLARAYSRA